MMKIQTSLMAGGLAAVFAGGASAAAFSNGSFETPDVPTGTPGDNGDITGPIGPWTLDETSGDDIRHLDGDFFGGGVVAQHGDQYVGFTAFGAADGGVLSQAFDTVIGQAYTVSFWVNNASFGPSTHSLTAAVDNTAGDAAVGTPSQDDTWENVSFNFTASSTTTTLSFTSAILTGDSASTDVLLDNVTVSEVPEPGSLALLGLGGLLIARRRRR